MLSHSLLDQIGWSTIVAGNLLAAAGMIGFFFLRHRKLHVRLAESWAAISSRNNRVDINSRVMLGAGAGKAQASGSVNYRGISGDSHVNEPPNCFRQ